MEYIYENHDVKGLVFSESKEPLPDGVLAKVKGASFFLDGFSRNGRFYPKKLWENALKNQETKNTISRGLMFGCIGHPKDYSLDELLESGKVSHKVTDIQINENSGEGIAEYEILDTPSGRILNTVLRSGSEMYVSTRAFGGFSNETKDKDGKKYKVLDEKNFVIESIDFVIQPGFLETNPKLIESLKEDFLELEEKDKIVHIECEEGICGLKFENLEVEEVEVKEVEEEVKEVEEEVKEVEEVSKEIDTSLLEHLAKEELILMIKNVVEENNLLSLSPKKEGLDGGIVVSSKLIMNYVSYIEILLKLVRYKVEYEKYYDDLIQFLDKDIKITVNDMNSVSAIADKILKEKDVEESIIHVCERINELTKKINNDGEKNDDEKTDKEGKTSSEKEPSSKGIDTSTEIKSADESAIDFLWDLKEREVEVKEIVYEEDKTKIIELKSKNLKLKEATISLTKTLEEALNKSAEKEIVKETVIEYKIPDDINSRFIEINETVEKTNKQKLELEKTIEELRSEIENEQLLREKLRDENESLKESIETNKVYFKEIVEDNEKEKSDLEEAFHLEESEKKKTQNALNETLKKVDDLYEKIQTSSAKYYALYYRLELPVVEKLMGIYESEERLLLALEKEEKLNFRKNEKEIEIIVPTYSNRSESSSEAKTKFLESLTK